MILLIDNYDSFTWNLVQCLRTIDSTLDVEVVRNDRITVAEAEALEPALPDQPGDTQDHGANDAHLDLHQEELGRTEHLQLAWESIGLLHMQQRQNEPLQQCIAHEEEQEGEWDRCDQGEQEPATELVEVVSEGHSVVVGMGWHLQHG